MDSFCYCCYTANLAEKVANRDHPKSTPCPKIKAYVYLDSTLSALAILCPCVHGFLPISAFCVHTAKCVCVCVSLTIHCSFTWFTYLLSFQFHDLIFHEVEGELLKRVNFVAEPLFHGSGASCCIFFLYFGKRTVYIVFRQAKKKKKKRQRYW